MDATSLLFWVFAAITVISALRVVTARNPVHAVLFLVLTFFTAACIWMLLRAEFLAITLVLVYVGAVMVLFLFVVMMLDISIDRLRTGFWGHFPLAIGVGAVVVLELAAVIWHAFRGIDGSDVPPLPKDYSNTKALGTVLYTEYVYALQVAGAILLVAMIAAIALTLRSRKDSKAQDPGEQVRVKASDRVRLVRMPAQGRNR